MITLVTQVKVAKVIKIFFNNKITFLYIDAVYDGSYEDFFKYPDVLSTAELPKNELVELNLENKEKEKGKRKNKNK